MNLHAKFDVSSSNRSRDMEEGPKISKVGHVTPFQPPLTKFCISFVNTPSDESACQI